MTGWDVPHLMSADDVGQCLGVTGQTVHRIRRRGHLPGVPVGKFIMYDPSDVRAFIENQKTGGHDGHAAPSDTGGEADASGRAVHGL